jgi:RNA polymerase sigma-70 factor (ECF subfamily)
LDEYLTETEPLGAVVSFEPAPNNLDAIAAGAARGDAASILQLYDRFGPLVNRLVWRVLGPDHEHNDIVHDVFISVLESIGRVKTPSLLEQWICSVTVNTVRNEIRKRRFYRVFHFASNADDYAVPSDPDAHLALKRYYEVLDGMSANDRIVFTLRFIDGRRLAEIGSICDCSLAAVKRRMKRARTEFLKRVGEEGDLLHLGKGLTDD